MKVCRNCHTENPPWEVFCSECGMSLMRALTVEAARRIKEGSGTQPQQPVSASGIVYLNGEQFARPWTWGIADDVKAVVGTLVHFPFVEYRGRHGKESVKVPYSGQLVWRGDLANSLFQAAFVSLAQQGYISLRLEKRKTLLRATEAVAITQQKTGDDLYPSLERTIMDALSGDPKEDWVKAVVGRVIGPRRWDPSESVVDIVIERFVERGWLYQQAVAPTGEDRALLAAFAGEAEILKAQLQSFATELPRLHERLLRDVQAGIQSRTM